MKKLIVVFSLILIVAGLGCTALSHYVTPAEIDGGAVEYAVSAGVADSNDYAGYPNLAKARKLPKDVDNAHLLIQQDLQQKMQKDDLEHAIHQKVSTSNYTTGLQREEMLFGEKGLLSLGLSMAGFGTLTGFIGLMRKRPGDVTQTDMEQAVAQATGKTTEELSAKQKQFVQVVSGVKEFMKLLGDQGSEVLEMKRIFNESQDKATQIAVAEAKKSV